MQFVQMLKHAKNFLISVPALAHRVNVDCNVPNLRWSLSLCCFCVIAAEDGFNRSKCMNTASRRKFVAECFPCFDNIESRFGHFDPKIGRKQSPRFIK